MEHDVFKHGITSLYLAVVSMLFFVFFCGGEGGGAHVRAVFLPLSPVASTLVCLVDLSVKSFVYIFFLFWIILCY